MLKLNRNPEIPVTTEEETRVSRLNSCEALLTWSNSRGKPSFPLQLQKSTIFPTSSQDESQFPCFSWRGILTFPSHLKRTPVSPIGTQEKPQVSFCKFKGPQVSLQLEISPDSPTATQMEPKVSRHNRKGGLTPLFVAPLEKAQVLCLNSTGGLTALLQLERKVEIHASTQDEA